MKIVNVIGGLGNQMFQYAFAVALNEKYENEDIYIDTHHYMNPIVKTFMGNNFYHNGYEINRIFPDANLQIATVRNVLSCSYYIPNYILSRVVRHFFPIRKNEFIQNHLDAYVFNEKALSEQRYVYFEGYWMSPKYFDFCKDKIRETFKMRPFNSIENMKNERELLKSNSITIHVRRGDYLKSDIFNGICSLDYYKEAIRQAKEIIDNPVFFVFSNDQKWCIENLKESFGNSKVNFVLNNSGNESYRDMQLISIARCNILANSSFSWWGAYLNSREDQIVFVPRKWTNQISDKDVYLEDWIKI